MRLHGNPTAWYLFLATGFKHPSVVLTAADVFHLLTKNAHKVTGDTQPFRHISVSNPHALYGNITLLVTV